VARRAGVSQTTVSLVLSGKATGRVSTATAEAVRRAARELGYRPNAAARALRSGTAAAVGLVVSDVTHPFFGLTLRGAQRAAWEAGHVVVLIDDNYGAAWGDGSVEALRAGTIDGFLFFAADPPPSLRRPGAPPVVLIEAEQGRLPHVRLDVEHGADLAMEHLRALGHTRIAYVESAIAGQTFDRRRARWAAHLREMAEDPGDQVVVAARFDPESAIATGHELLARRERMTAVVCDDDLLAAGVLAAAAERGIDVPGELSVVGFDDLPIARLASPPLTTVRLDAGALGAAAFELLHTRLQGRRTRNRILEAELVVRASTGPARKTGRRRAS
jgi:LacI family transcriptional regulator, repressor for deo operon, udp, cdd, tsx, nupC, and nupG